MAAVDLPADEAAEDANDSPIVNKGKAREDEAISFDVWQEHATKEVRLSCATHTDSWTTRT